MGRQPRVERRSSARSSSSAPRSSSFGYNWPNLPYGVNGELNDNLNHRWTDDGSGTTFTYRFGSRGPQRPSPLAVRRATPRCFKDNWMGGDHSIKFGMVSERESQEFQRRRLPRRGHAGVPQRLAAAELHDAVPRHDAQHAARRRPTRTGTTARTSTIPSRSSSASRRAWACAGTTTTRSIPDQDILESRFRDFFYAGVPVQTSVGPYSLPRTPYRRQQVHRRRACRASSAIRRSIAPRFGVSWDIDGDGKTRGQGQLGPFPPQHRQRLRPTSTRSASATATFDWLDAATTTTVVAPVTRTSSRQNELGQNRAVAASCTVPRSIPISRIPTPTPRASGSSASSATTWACASATPSAPTATARHDVELARALQPLHAAAHLRRSRRRRHRRQRRRRPDDHDVRHPRPGAGEPHRRADGRRASSPPTAPST